MQTEQHPFGLPTDSSAHVLRDPGLGFLLLAGWILSSDFYDLTPTAASTAFCLPQREELFGSCHRACGEITNVHLEGEGEEAKTRTQQKRPDALGGKLGLALSAHHGVH
jgi:hypothetical protein